MKLLITRDLPPRIMAEAAARYDMTLRKTQGKPDAAELCAMLRDYDVVLCGGSDRFSAEIFAQVPQPRVKLLANYGAGYNQIDVAAAKAVGIAVTNTPGAVTDATADIAVALLLMTARRLGEGERLVRSGKWDGLKLTEMLGTQVTGKSLGVIGFGRIGKAIARRCHFGFGMDVRFFNRSVVTDAEFPARQVPLDEAMAADFVVVAVSGNPSTWHLIDAAALTAMQPGGILINISRGDVVDEAALIRALQNKTIAGAGLDVFEFEPKVPVELIAMDNVTLTPHLGTANLEAREAMGLIALENIAALAEGRPLVTPV